MCHPSTKLLAEVAIRTSVETNWERARSQYLRNIIRNNSKKIICDFFYETLFI